MMVGDRAGSYAMLCMAPFVAASRFLCTDGFCRPDLSKVFSCAVK